MRVLITGASGLLGKALVDRFSKIHELLCITSSGQPGMLSCDLRDEVEVERFFDRYAPQAVIHAAAFSNVDICERDPAAAHRSNVAETRHLAQRCRDHRLPMVHVSTDYVFSGMSTRSYTESDPCFPVNLYGLTKLLAEQWVKRLAPYSVIVRPSWLFGSASHSNFVNMIIDRVKRKEPIAVLSDQKNRPTHVEDLSLAIGQGLEYLAHKKRKTRQFSEMFHFCNSGVTTRYEMAVRIGNAFGLKRSEIKRVDPKAIQGRVAIRPIHSVLSTDRFTHIFGERPRRWQEALDDYLATQGAA